MKVSKAGVLGITNDIPVKLAEFGSSNLSRNFVVK